VRREGERERWEGTAGEGKERRGNFGGKTFAQTYMCKN